MNPALLRKLAWLLCSLPLVYLVVQAARVQLGANPVETLEHETGSWALILFLCSLAITPVRRVTGRNELAPLRRTFGLFGFFYAALHFFVYLLLDRSLLWSEIVVDFTKRPYVMLGMAALVLFATLAATSPKRVVKALGAKRWKRVHQLVYLAVPLAVAHFMWTKWDKNLLERPLVYAAVVLALLAWRVWVYAKARRQVA
ncbi:MAG: sulfoxide reductase heme-binding subunit YedZ [Limnobacter sp.]|nr:sulfoxide reductase heme-binding subunit YedZ [Limnobacter sp.]